MGAPEVRKPPAGSIDERFFYLLADAIPHLVWSASVDGLEDYCNRRLCEYAGLTLEDMRGSGWETIVHPDDIERCRALWSEAQAKGARFEIEYRLRRHDGAYLWHHGTAEPLRAEGRIVRWFGTCTDIDARKRAEERLEELQRTTRTVADGIPHMLWTSRADGTLDFLNAHTLAYTGLTEEQTKSGAWKNVLHPEDLAKCVEDWQRALAQGDGYEAEYRLRRRDGKYRWHYHHVLPMRDSDGRVLLWYGTCTDIDDQKRIADGLQEQRRSLEALVASSTEALRSSESRLRAIIDNEPECVKLLDVGCRVLEMNAAGLRMVEADSLEQIRGQSVCGIIAPEYRDAFCAMVRRVCGGERAILEFEIIGLKGARRRLQTHSGPFRDAARGETLLLGVTRDVTEQRHAERALAESERRFRSFMDSMPVVAWIKDSSFRYSWINEGYRLRRRRTLEQVQGRDDFEIRHEGLARLFRAGDEEALRRNAPVQSVLEDKGEEGGAVHWLIVRFPIPDASGAMGVGGIAFDISERIELERALRENETRVVQATETVRQLMNRLVHAQEAERHRVAGDLHDLIGQKLTALGINLDIVRQQMPQAGASSVAGRLHQIATLLEETIGAVRGLISDLRPQVLDEHGLSAALYQHAAAFEARTGLRVEVSGADSRLPLPHDVAIALFRIAQEALTNAAKHSGASHVRVHVRKSGESVELLVEDNGCGLRGATEERRRDSRGWGLRMMRERAEAVGGRLALAAAHPGTRVIVEVPLSRADQRNPR